MLIFVFFFVLWLLFNGRCTWDVVGFGLVLAALVGQKSGAGESQICLEALWFILPACLQRS